MNFVQVLVTEGFGHFEETCEAVTEGGGSRY